MTELKEKLETTDITGLATQTTLASLLAKDFATQTTLAAILTELGDKLEASDISNLALETGGHIDILTVLLAELNQALDTEGTDELRVKVLNIAEAIINPAKEDGNLATIAGLDFATQTTLALIKAKTDNLNAQLSTLATQATLASILAKLNVNLSTVATQTTLNAMKTQTDKLTFDGSNNLKCALGT